MPEARVETVLIGLLVAFFFKRIGKFFLNFLVIIFVKKRRWIVDSFSIAGRRGGGRVGVRVGGYLGDGLWSLFFGHE